MLLVDLKKRKVAIVGKKQKKMTTNVPCRYKKDVPYPHMWPAGCPYCGIIWSYPIEKPEICPNCKEMTRGCKGRLIGHYDELEKVWIFRCNECGKEAGRGRMEK